MPVLVVDDNPVARELMLTMGQSLGWAVETADGGEAALALVDERARRGEPYQAVFMDWQMPGMDGWQASARIRSEPVNASAAATSPVIMMVTAHGREMLAQQTAEVQNLIDGYLVKPVTASMLFDAMQNALPPSGTAEVAHGKRTLSEVVRPLAGIRLLVVEDNALAIGTHGRSFYVMDDIAALRSAFVGQTLRASSDALSRTGLVVQRPACSAMSAPISRA